MQFHKKPILFFILFLITSTTLISQNSYIVSFQQNHLHIEASFSSAGHQLAMIIGNSPNLQNGQQDLVKNMTVYSGDKQQLLQATERGIWQLPKSLPKESSSLRISYDIFLDFDQYEWNSGKEEMAYQSPEGSIFTMRSIFIFPLEKYSSQESVQIHFQLPEQTNLISPWNLNNPDQEHILVPNFNEFLSNSFLVGDFKQSKFTVGALSFTLALVDSLAKYEPLFREVIEASAQFFSQNIGQKEAKDYLVIYAPGNRNDGGAFENSFSQTIYGQINSTSRSIWGSLSTHELSHLWSGRDIKYSSSKEEWILEGFADYFTILAMAQTKMISPQEAIKKLENSLRKYMIGKYLRSPGVSILDAGEDKNNHRMLIYGGGAIAGLALDILIRQNTANQHNLFTIMQDFFMRRQQKTFSSQDLKEQIEALTNQSLDGFFDQYLQGQTVLALSHLATQLGLQLDQFAFEDLQLSIITKDHPLRKAMFGF